MEWFLWLLFGFALGGAVFYLLNYLAKNEIVLKWYEWFLGVVSLFLLIFTVETFVHSLAEYQNKAAWLSLVFIGIPFIVLAVVTTRLVNARK